MRRFLLLLAFTALLAPAVQAQPPHVLNAPPLGSVEADRLADFLGGAGPTPDTTAPWRYYPLHVGDAWEYSAGFNTLIRRDIVGEKTFEGRRYWLWQEVTFVDGEVVAFIPPTPIRFDTLSSLVFELFWEEERRFGFTPCPFRADFGTTVDCDPKQADFRLYDVTGTHEGGVVFGGSPPDTVHTTLKLYADQEFILDFGYAADIGEVYSESDVRTYFIHYARVDGVAYGASLLPTGVEPGVPEEGVELTVWPNPARGCAEVAVTLPAPSHVRVAAYDLLGREVAVLASGALPAGRHALPLDASSLPPGVYVVRVTAGAAAVTRTVTVLR